MLMLLTPMALAYVLETNRKGYTVYVWPTLASMSLAMFYQGGVKLIAAMEEPFGRELDDLRPDNIIISTERTIFNFLVAPSITALDSEESDHGSSRDDELAKCKVQLE